MKEDKEALATQSDDMRDATPLRLFSLCQTRLMDMYNVVKAKERRKSNLLKKQF